MTVETQDTLATNKGTLAKLLATENITIQHRPTRTARFDLKRRVLICPIWKDMDGSIYDLLMGHEISHALHTPMVGWHDSIVTDKKRPKIKRFLNIIEDARIERIIKTKYPGLKKSFSEAYQSLFDRDLFKIKKLKGDYSKMNLIDRINLHFKLGALANVQFDKEEMKFVNRTKRAQTWDEVAQIAREVYDYCKYTEPKKDQKKEDNKDKDKAKQPKKQPKDKPDQEQDPEDGDDEGESDDTSDDGEPGDELDDNDEGESSESDDPGESKDDAVDPDSETDESDDGDGDDSDSEADEGDAGETDDDEGETDDEPESTSNGKQAGLNKDGDDHEENTAPMPEPDSETDEAFRQNEDQLIDKYGTSTMYVNLPGVNLKNIVVDHKTVYGTFEEGAKAQLSRNGRNMELNTLMSRLNANFHRRNKNYIGMLVKEFEMKKNANQYARQLISKTGVLDDRKLARYKFSADIFRKVTQVTKGKSHGMILFLDLSGSMEEYLKPVIEQLLILVTFCKRVGIPFDAYGFGDSHRYYGFNNNNDSPWIQGDNTIAFDAKKFCLRHLISSNMSGNAYKRAFGMLNMVAETSNPNGRDQETAQCFSPVTTFAVKDVCVYGFDMGGTPYMQTLTASRQLIADFKNTHHTDITNVIYLTDGDGDGTLYMPDEYVRMLPGEKQQMRIGFIDRATKQSVLAETTGTCTNQAAITKLIAQVTGARHFGFFFASKFSILYKLGLEPKLQSLIPELDKQMNTNGFVAVPNLGYQTYYYIDTNQMNYKGTLNIDPSQTKTDMLNNFKDHQFKKMNSKLIVRKFAAEVAE